MLERYANGNKTFVAKTNSGLSRLNKFNNEFQNMVTSEVISENFWSTSLNQQGTKLRLE